ncbi:MAG: quinol monooxygenase YgiN [Halieaceae bacterium]|jgi:quinol monooxygenase YgiN
MTIGVIATITIKEGRNAEFEQALLSLAKQVRSSEPGNIFYLLHRSKSEPQVYKVLEQYHSENDLAAHAKSQHYQDANKVLAGLVAAAPIVEILDAVE